MKFRNPQNDYIEEKSNAWLWTLLFGGLYFLSNEMWGPGVLWCALGLGLHLSSGISGTIFLIFVSIVFAIFSEKLVRTSYLRKGWIEVNDQ